MLTYPIFEGVSLMLLGISLLWTAIWEGIGMWKAAKNGQVYWFIIMLLLNTLGILPIIYLLWFQKIHRHRRK